MEDRLNTQTDSQREALIAEMVRDSEESKIELPSEIAQKTVLNPEDKEAPPTIVSKVTSAGYVYVWDSRSFVRVPALYYMLPQILRQKRQDGSYRFTTNDPGKLPKRGTHKCWLHADDPHRAHYDDLGFRTCKKDNITNPYQVTQHMKSKHKAEYAAILEEKKETERQEDRQLQRMLLEDRLPKPVVVEETKPVTNEVVSCPNCGKEYKAKGKAYKAHVRACK